MVMHTTKRALVLRASVSLLAGTVSTVFAVSPLDFSDEAVARGVDYHIGFNFAQFGAGLGLMDLDGDGDLDIMIAGASDNTIGLFENDGTGNFTDRTATSGMTNSSVSSGISGADYDNDGDIDVFIGGWFTPSRLYRNNGDMTFTDVAVAAGVSVNCPSMGASWGDIDNDGHLDLYSTVRTFTFADPTNNFFFRNNGDGTFSEQAIARGIQATNDPTLLSLFFDYDRDGDDDLYLGTDKGSQKATSNRLYENDGAGNFTEVTAETNAYGYVDCMGVAIGDLNFDGHFDMYMTNVFAGNKLFMNDGSGVYVDQTLAAGVGSYRVGWGTVFADFDNDTELDIYLCNMAGDNRLYRGSQSWPLLDEAPTANVDEESNVFCVSVGDVDGDGDLDMLVGDSDGKAHLYMNNSPDVSLNNWVRLNIVGNNANKFAVGTCVDIMANNKHQVREIRSGVNYKVQDEFTLHYGLGRSPVVEEINVVYLGNEIRTLTNAPANEVWTIYPQARLGDKNVNGRIDWYEVVEAVNNLTAPGTSIVPGQEIFDMDGDFDIDLDDLADMGFRALDPSVFNGTRHP